MFDNKLFDVLEEIARTVRIEPRPFGGLQLILCGDFFQLPPVSLGKFGSKFVFESAAWTRCNIQTVELTEVVRQAGDLQFVNLLNQVRLGLCTEATAHLLRGCHVNVKPTPTDGIIPTKLYCRNVDVDGKN